MFDYLLPIVLIATTILLWRRSRRRSDQANEADFYGIAAVLIGFGGLCAMTLSIIHFLFLDRSGGMADFLIFTFVLVPVVCGGLAYYSFRRAAKLRRPPKA